MSKTVLKLSHFLRSKRYRNDVVIDIDIDSTSLRGQVPREEAVSLTRTTRLVSYLGASGALGKWSEAADAWAAGVVVVPRRHHQRALHQQHGVRGHIPGRHQMPAQLRRRAHLRVRGANHQSEH